MKRQPRGFSIYVYLLNLFTVLLLLVASSNNSVLAAPAPAPGQTPGSLAIVGKDGKIQGDCPLKHTDVRAGISGFLARVTVTQISQTPRPRTSKRSIPFRSRRMPLSMT
jgi:hypothetical protein